MPVDSRQQIEETLIGIIEDLIQDWEIDEENITSATSIVHDLDFASVDIIQLCVAIEQHYKKKLGFQSLLMQDGSYVTDLTVAQIVEFLNDKIEAL